MSTTIRRATHFALALAALAIVSAPLMAAVPVGQVVGDGATLDGVAVPSGTTLLSPSVVETADEPVILHLSNGQALTMGPESSAVLESSFDGEIRLTVDQGEVALREPSGAVTTLAANSQVVLDSQGQIGEGARVPGSEVKLCRLHPDSERTFEECTASPAAADCDWQLLEVPADQAGDYLGQAAVEAGLAYNDLGLDENCALEPGGSVTDGDGGGLSTAAKVGIGVGATAVTIVTIDQLDDDDDRSPSPSQPNQP